MQHTVFISHHSKDVKILYVGFKAEDSFGNEDIHIKNLQHCMHS